MGTVRTASDQIVEEVGSWPGVNVEEGDDFGEISFRLGRRELGHLHGDHAAHFGFPKQVWDDLTAQGRIEHHPVFPNKRGPAARRIEDDADVQDVIELLRLTYERVLARRGAPVDAEA